MQPHLFHNGFRRVRSNAIWFSCLNLWPNECYLSASIYQFKKFSQVGGNDTKDLSSMSETFFDVESDQRGSQSDIGNNDSLIAGLWVKTEYFVLHQWFSLVKCMNDLLFLQSPMLNMWRTKCRYSWWLSKDIGGSFKRILKSQPLDACLGSFIY